MIAWLKNCWARLSPAKNNGAPDYGRAGEAEAARFLSNERGMKILVRNWRSPKDRRDEIDLVCRDSEGVLVFVEVKSRATKNLLRGYENVDHAKKEVLKRAADAYLRGLGPRWRGLSYRLDVVVIERRDDGTLAPHHFENVPLFSRGKHL